MIEINWDAEPRDADIEAAMERAAETALRHEGRAGDIGLSIVAPARIRALNSEFRHKDAVTDVLTFPAWEGEKLLCPPDGYLGDIAVCCDRAREQAAEYGHSLVRECAFLTVHGTLHLLGFDHMEPGEERIMIGKQKEIMEEMGLSR